MNYIPLGASLVTALILGLLTGAGAVGLAVFLICGALAAWLAQEMPPGSERVYWSVLGLVVLALAAAFLGMGVHRLAAFAPVILALCYFIARIAGRLTGRKSV